MTEQCTACGDRVHVDHINDDGHGPCCADLPQPWHRGREGLYNQPTPADSDAEELDHREDESDEDTLHCHECGSRRWVVRFSGETITESEPGDSYVYYDEGYSEPSARCAECGEPCNYPLEHA